jgi:hypothetical protein
MEKGLKISTGSLGDDFATAPIGSFLHDQRPVLGANDSFLHLVGACYQNFIYDRTVKRIIYRHGFFRILPLARNVKLHFEFLNVWVGRNTVEESHALRQVRIRGLGPSDGAKHSDSLFSMDAILLIHINSNNKIQS